MGGRGKGEGEREMREEGRREREEGEKSSGGVGDKTLEGPQEILRPFLLMAPLPIHHVSPLY